MGDATTQLTHDSDTSSQQFHVDEDLENTHDDAAKNMGGDYDDDEIDEDEISSEVDEDEDDTIHDDKDNQMTDTVNYAYADDVFGRSTCMKNFFGLQEEMHHAFKATVINNMTKNNIAGILPEPKTLQDLFNVSLEVKTFWINAARREITTTVEFRVFNANVTPRAGEQVIPIKMLFKIKFDENGNIDKFKVRAAVRGDLQKRLSGALDNIPSWVPRASALALRRFLSEAAKYGRIVNQIDFIAAFCQGLMRGCVFVMFPDLLSTFLPEYEHLFGIPLLVEKGI